MTSEQASAVLVERRGPVLIATINRPEARNAVNSAVWSGLGGALAEAEADDSVRAFVVTGAGDQAFCAGADLKALARGESLAPRDREQVAWGFAGYVRHPISKPTIAAVNGTAFGGGTELVLASDLAVSADTATFGLPEVRRGVIAGAGGAFRLAQQIPRKLAMELLLTGEAISADRALELGLINRVVAASRVLEVAVELAQRISANAPLAVQASKRIALRLTDGEAPDEAERWSQTMAEGKAIQRSADAREGARAFADKRDPVWSGS